MPSTPTERMDFRLTDEQALLRDSVRQFAERAIRPHVRAWDDAQELPRTLLESLGAMGLMGIQVPEGEGGAGMSAVDYCICIEELARIDPGVSLSVAAHNGLGTAHIGMFGTPAQREKYLVPLAQGRWLAAWALTEAQSGSDAAAMRTTAAHHGDEWVLNGTKQFTTHGRDGDVLVVMAVTNRAKGSRGISAFIIDRGTPGLRAGRKEDKLGMRASETSEVLLEQCRVGPGQLLGAEGRLRSRPSLRLRARAVRAENRHVSEHPRQAGGHRGKNRGRTALDLPRGGDEGRGSPHDDGSRDGQALCE
jgi:alkylation response protein AidB-like acyl-CoA dehydrogenase